MKKNAYLYAAVAVLSLGSSMGSANAAELIGFEPTGELLYAGAGPRSVIADQQVADNSPVTQNGIAWYNYESFAFTAAGSTVNTNTCDTNPAQNLLCWHTDDDEGGRYMYTGYNYLQLTEISDTSGVYRVIYQSDDPGYYPSGDQVNVPVSDLDGWELCWADDWGNADDYDQPAIYFDDLLAQCSGDFLLFGVTDDVVEVVAEEDQGLAETGFDVQPILAFAAASVVAGALAFRRHRAH